MIIFSLLSLSASSLRSVVSAPSLPFSPSSHTLLTPLSACKTREKVRKRKKPAKPAGRLSRGRQSWVSALGELLLGGLSGNLGVCIPHCRGVGDVPILRLIWLAFLRLQERKNRLRRVWSGRCT